MPKSLYARMPAARNTTVVEAACLRDLSADYWRVIAYRGFDDDQWLYVEGLAVDAFENLRHLNMFILTQRREDERFQFVLLAKVARDMDEAWPGVLRNALNKVRGKP